MNTKSINTWKDLSVLTKRSNHILRLRYLVQKVQGRLLAKYFEASSNDVARQHANAWIHLPDEKLLRDALATGRPIIFTVLHDGFFLAAFNKLLTEFGPHRYMNVFYADPIDTPTNQRFTDLLGKQFPDCKPLYNNARGIVSARKALANNGCVFIMPDVFTNIGETIYIPFCSRLYPTMPGTAFLAIKSDCLVVPVITRATGLYSFSVLTPSIIDARDYQSANGIEQAIHDLTTDMWRVFEKHLKQDPCGWQYWEQFLQYGIPIPEINGASSLPNLIADWSKRYPQFAALLQQRS
jgi:lauroyl/myristoyl acyltransferase